MRILLIMHLPARSAIVAGPIRVRISFLRHVVFCPRDFVMGERVVVPFVVIQGCVDAPELHLLHVHVVFKVIDILVAK